MKKKCIGKQCYVASLTGRFIVASDQLTTASLLLKAVIYVSCEYPVEFVDTKEAIKIRISKKNRQHNDRATRTPLKTSESIRVTIIDIRQCKCYSKSRKHLSFHN